MSDPLQVPPRARHGAPRAGPGPRVGGKRKRFKTKGRRGRGFGHAHSQGDPRDPEATRGSQTGRALTPDDPKQTLPRRHLSLRSPPPSRDTNARTRAKKKLERRARTPTGTQDSSDTNTPTLGRGCPIPIVTPSASPKHAHAAPRAEGQSPPSALPSGTIWTPSSRRSEAITRQPGPQQGPLQN